MNSEEIGIRAVEMLRARMAMADANGYPRNASGKTSKSFTFEASNLGLHIFASGEHAPLATLQYGSKPGIRGGWFFGVIEQWIIDKGISYSPIPYVRRVSANWQPKYTPEERGRKALAGAIASKIVSRGTKRHEHNSIDLYTPIQEWAINEMQKHYINPFIEEILR